MSEVLVFEFSTPNAIELYKAVNQELGFQDEDKWPNAMISHVAAESGDKLVVLEVWESRTAQSEFMNSHLRPAFEKAKVPKPTRTEWFNQAGEMHRQVVLS